MASAAVLSFWPVNSQWISLSRPSVMVLCSSVPLAPMPAAMPRITVTLPALIMVAMADSRNCPLAIR